MPLTLAQPVHSELVIKKSRFIGCVQAVPDRAAAQAVVAQLRREHPGATHVCWAFLAGGQSAANDDGEPGGTAGRPMLEVLRRQDLEGVLATVVRYFGGVKLGAGGLVRAYTDAVAQALLRAAKVPMQKTRDLALRRAVCAGGTGAARTAARRCRAGRSDARSTQSNSNSRRPRTTRLSWSRASTRRGRARCNGWIERPAIRRARPALNRNDVLAVEQLLDLAAELPTLATARRSCSSLQPNCLHHQLTSRGSFEVDQAAIGGYGFEHICHGVLSPFLF